MSLFRAMHGTGPASRRTEHFSLPETLSGMGLLLALDVATPQGLVTWCFRSPFPRLCFTRLAASKHTRARSRLWVVGGAFYFDERGIFHGSGCSARPQLQRVKRSEVADAGTLERYANTHGGQLPRESLRGVMEVPSQVVTAGTLHAVTYETEKGDGYRGPYRHPFSDRAAPQVCVSTRAIVLVGGHYTVTPHGIEDLP